MLRTPAARGIMRGSEPAPEEALSHKNARDNGIKTQFPSPSTDNAFPWGESTGLGDFSFAV